jgi:phosphatidylinositol phospholipase C, gamma-1
MPHPHWAHGVQIVALNFQTADSCAMQLNQGKFLINGRQGYVRKPEPNAAGAVSMAVAVLGAMHVGGGNSKPSVLLQLFGADGDVMDFKTKQAKEKDAPVWTDNNTFNVGHVGQPRHAILHIELVASSGSSLGYACIPLSSIRAGFRVIPLEVGHPYSVYPFP